MWLPPGEFEGMLAFASNARMKPACAAGPLHETVSDTWEWLSRPRRRGAAAHWSSEHRTGSGPRASGPLGMACAPRLTRADRLFGIDGHG